jgi:hypothetical protein
MMTNPSSTLQSPFDQGELQIITERVDDIGLLMGNMIKMNLPGNQRWSGLFGQVGGFA